MTETIVVNDYARKIMEALPKGILLNTQGEKFNSMVIGWGDLGRVWNVPVFVVYVRENRYTKSQLDKTGEFTVSIPLEKPIPEINRICGSLSGHHIDKQTEAKLTLEPGRTIQTSGIREYPLTLECKVLYTHELDIKTLPEAIQTRMYPQNVDGSYPMANRDAHTVYVGQIMDAYIIR